MNYEAALTHRGRNLFFCMRECIITVHYASPGWWRIVSGELFTFVERWAGAAVSMGMEVEGKIGCAIGGCKGGFAI